MNTLFYRAWLPVSLAVHVVILFALNIIPFGAPKVGGNTPGYVPIDVLNAAPLPPPVVPPKLAVKPLDPPTVKPVTGTQRFIPDTERQPVLPKNVPLGNQSVDPSITTGNARKPGNGTINKEKGPGIGAKAPPAIMSAKNGTGFDAAPGVPGSMGTGGSNEVGVSGPSYGAKSRYGNVFIPGDKVNTDIDKEYTAMFTVQVSVKGTIADLDFTKRTGKNTFDIKARDLVMTRYNDFTPAMKNGIPIVWKTHVGVTFSKSGIRIEEIP